MSYSAQWAPYLATQLWSWRAFVFEPAMELKRRGLYRPATIGTEPDARPFRGGGPDLSERFTEPVLLDERHPLYETVEEFDKYSEIYERFTTPFSGPIFDEAVEFLRPHLVAGARILDPSAGPGTEAIELSRLVPHGEVVAADLSRGMVELAYANAQEQGIDNMAFFQADVGDPPDAFTGYFDAVFCCLAFHHYPDGEAAAAAFRKVLAPGGKVFIADGGPAWWIALARLPSLLGDPGFVRHRTGDEFIALLKGAGFTDVYWEEALPGMGFTVAST